MEYLCMFADVSDDYGEIIHADCPTSAATDYVKDYSEAPGGATFPCSITRKVKVYSSSWKDVEPITILVKANYSLTVKYTTISST